MNKKHCLLVISGQTRELPRAISSIRAFTCKLIATNNIRLSVLIVVWDTSYYFFPTPTIKSYITDVTVDYVKSYVLDGYIFKESNTSIKIVPSNNVSEDIVKITSFPKYDLINDAEFIKVAYLNSVIYGYVESIEKQMDCKFEYIIKTRPDLYIEESVSLLLPFTINDNDLYADDITTIEDPNRKLGDFVSLFGRDAFRTWCNSIFSMTVEDMETLDAHVEFGKLENKNVTVHDINTLTPIRSDFLRVVPLRPVTPFLPGEVMSFETGWDIFYKWGHLVITKMLQDEFVQYMLNNDIKFNRIEDGNMKVIIPMPERSIGFSKNENDTPKPLIEFLGKPMIQHVVEHLGLTEQCEHIFMCPKEYIDKYKLHELFSNFVPKFKIVPIFGVTDGATAVQRALTRVNMTDSVIIVNIDHLVHWDKRIDNLDSDGTIFCFWPKAGSKWSYAAIDEYRPETSCLYYWRTFKQYLDAYQKMVAANDRVNNEFHVATVYKYALDQKINIRYIHKVDQVGTPEELEEYLSNIPPKSVVTYSCINNYCESLRPHLYNIE